MKKLGIILTILGPLILIIGFSWPGQILHLVNRWPVNPATLSQHSAYNSLQSSSLYAGLGIFFLGLILALFTRKEDASNWNRIFLRIGISIFLVAVIFIILVYAAVFHSGW